jgi:hypothetical protein
MSTETNYFAELNKVNCAEHVEKKNGFSYLSWPFAISELRKRHPSATWEVVRFDGKPYLQTDLGFFVEVAVTVEGVRLSQIHPVLDHRNKPIMTPDPFHINTSIQRCLVKAIALHGLGLFIYAGEDLPEGEPGNHGVNEKGNKKAFAAPHKPTDGAEDRVDPKRKGLLTDIATSAQDRLDEGKDWDAYSLLEQEVSDPDEKVFIWTFFDSKARRRLKDQAELAKKNIPAMAGAQ